jgi:muramoyltetrapeptide carboxypeptidase LdcA involved in peptidoglycan recycling
MTSSSRRTFLAAGALTAAASIAGAAPVTNAYPKLVHHVFFWLKNPDSKDDLNKLLAGLQTLAKIESVRGIHIGVPASTEKRPVVDATYSASEILFFDDVAGQNVYQEHPIHKEFVDKCSHLWERVVVYDAMAV